MQFFNSSFFFLVQELTVAVLKYKNENTDNKNQYYDKARLEQGLKYGEFMILIFIVDVLCKNLFNDGFLAFTHLKSGK